MDSHCGCNLNGVSFNHLFYADDSVLCAPSPSALQKLINICESFAQENGILYNIKKTKVMCFKPKCWKKIYIPSFTLCDNILSVVSNEKYLGVILSDELKDDKDLMRQLRCIYSYGNMLVKKFKKCSDNIKTHIFRTYCSNFYACQLWCNYSSSVYKKVKVAFNNVYRSLMSIKRGSSISMAFVQNNLNTFDCLIRKSAFSLRKRIFESENSLVHCVVQSVYFMSSCLSKKWNSILF